METITISSGHRFRQYIVGQETHFISDLPVEKGGEGTAPDPHHLLYGAWGACTNMTIQLYCARKGWPLQSVSTRFEIEERAGSTPKIQKHVHFQGDLTPQQQAHIQRIAEQCPVNKMILSNPQIQIHWHSNAGAEETNAG